MKRQSTEQLVLRVPASNGGQIRLQFSSPRGTPDEFVEVALRASLKMLSGGIVYVRVGGEEGWEETFRRESVGVVVM